MNPDRQIKVYEDCIARMEERKRNGSGDPDKLDQEIEKAYGQLALLKIRHSMNITT